jgi:hypothetical protein
VDVLRDSVNALRLVEEAKAEGAGAQAMAAARILATDVVDSFSAMREYLREVELCLERVDPHLCNNAGLVARLVDWEESWEVGMRYVQRTPLLRALCDFVTDIRAAQRLVPAFTSMCNDCDVELFLVLPRMIWLRYLKQPEDIELLKSLLPHHFELAKEPHSELQILNDKFRRVKDLMVGADPNGEAAAWETLVRRVVGGSSFAEKLYESLPSDLAQTVPVAVDELMHELERWSIELQRHCPEDWNQCSAVLVQCLTEVSRERRRDSFHV